MRTETFATPGAVRLNLDVPAGRIEVETGNMDETHVELEALSNNDAVREAVERSRIELLRLGDGFEVVVEVPSQRGVFISFSRGPDISFGGPEIRLRVSCPVGADLDVRTKSADLDARGEYGTVDVKTASGDVSVQGSRGDGRVKTASGDVHFNQVDARLDVHSASGDLQVGTVKGDAQIQLVSGDVSIGEAGGRSPRTPSPAISASRPCCRDASSSGRSPGTSASGFRAAHDSSSMRTPSAGRPARR
ncbi:DUF4097 family beta strand repeat-containing protein [soil metagenome]